MKKEKKNLYHTLTQAALQSLVSMFRKMIFGFSPDEENHKTSFSRWP